MQYDQLAPLKEQVLNDGEVYPVLRRAIVELYLQPGAILSIKDICEHFKMGRSPVRDALMRLDQEGLVTLLPQRGTMISRIDFSRVEQERFLRLSVEEEVMKLFMACHTPSDIMLLHEALRQQQELCDQKNVDTRRFLWLDDEFHQIFYAVTDKLFCLQAIQNLGGHYRRMRLLTCGDKAILQETIRQHSALLTALQARDTEQMCNIFHFHLRRLDREERLVVKKYPHLFASDTNQDAASPLWRADYLQTATGLEFDQGSYRETLEKAAAIIDLAAFRARQQTARERGRYLGIGFAAFSERTGYGSPAFAARGMEITPGWETVEIAMDPSGRLEARIGSSPHGQGLRTTLAQIIADEIGVTPADVRIVHGDTDRTPYGWGTFASRSLVIAGGASLLAARKIREKLLAIASHVLEAAAADIVLEDGNARVSGTDRAAPIAALARAAYHQAHIFKGEIAPGLRESAQYDPSGTFSNACHVAIVELDPETGRVALQSYLVVEDAGRIINPLIADGQVHGGVAQGIGNALYEEIVYDSDGNIQTATLADYMPPTAAEIPRLELHHIETPTEASITGAKGLGEGGAIGAPAAVLNAVNDALSIFGVAIDEVPATPQRIRAALRAAQAGHLKSEI